jgi:predicted RND superfamily exporter protein
MTTINNSGLEAYLDFSLAFTIVTAIVIFICIVALIYKEDGELRAFAVMCMVFAGFAWYFGFMPAKNATIQLLELRQVAEVTNK